MSTTLSIYLKYSGEGSRLARRAAEVLGARGFIYSLGDYDLLVDGRPWREAGVSVTWVCLDRTDLGEYGELACAEGTALAPYEYDLFVEHRAPRRPEAAVQLGWTFFERLTALNLPMVYVSREEWLLADFLPGRGIRNFPPETSCEERDRARWYEPRLHDDPMAPWPGELADEQLASPRSVLVFETDGCLQFVPVATEHGQRRWLVPVAEARSDITTADDLGRLARSAQRTVGRHGDQEEPLLDFLARLLLKSTEDFARDTVCVELYPCPDGLASGPCALSNLQGVDLPVARVVHHASATESPEVLGQTLLDLIEAARPPAQE